MRGVIAGVVLLNALTLFAIAFGGTVEGFFLGMGVTLVAAILLAIRGERAVAAGLAVALILSPLLAYPSCSFGFRGW
jgi:hypothetical protein